MSAEVIHLAVYDALADWEVGYATAHINSTDWVKRPGRFHVTTVGLSRDPITTKGGMRVVPDITIADVSAGDSAMLILPGADTWFPTDDSPNHPFTRLAEQFILGGVPVAAICGATLGLAAAGLLNDRDHTSNAPEFLAMATRYAGANHYQTQAAVNDQGVITANAMSPVAFAVKIFEELDLYAPDVAQAWFELYGKADPAAFYTLAAVS